MLTKPLLITTLACSLISTTQAATQLVLWTFGADSANYSTAPTSGTASGGAVLTASGGALDANGKNGVDYTDIIGTAHPGGQSAAWDDVKVTGPDAEMLIEFSSLGYEKLAFRFDYRSEGAVSFDLAYSLNGIDFTQITDTIGVLDNRSINVNWAAGTFDTFSADLSPTTALDNLGTLFIRMDDLEEGTGNDRFAFDNLEITGTAIPEPQTALLLGLSLLFGTFRRQKKAQHHR